MMMIRSTTRALLAANATKQFMTVPSPLAPRILTRKVLVPSYESASSLRLFWANFSSTTPTGGNNTTNDAQKQNIKLIISSIQDIISKKPETEAEEEEDLSDTDCNNTFHPLSLF